MGSQSWERRVSSPIIQVSKEEIYQIGMPMRSHNVILLFGLLVIISLTRALPLDADEELDSNDVEDRYDDEGDDDYNDPIEKRAISGFEHALRIRRSDEADQALRHAIRIRASPYVHALRIKKGVQYSHALRIRSSPYSHALRV